MLLHLRRNAVAYLALFIALSGTAIAATQLPKNSVGAKQLKKQSVNAAKVKKNSLTGNQINEAKLGKVPQAGNATTFDGKGPSAFLAANGKAVDADKLDGVDSAIFGDAQTYAGMNFEPRDSSATSKNYEGTGSISCEGAAEEFTYRAQLPEGAHVTQLDFRYLDNEAGVTASLELRAFDVFEAGASTVLLASVSTTGASAAERTASVPVSPPAVIDNGQFSYQVNWSPFICSSNMELAGATVHYTLPTG